MLKLTLNDIGVSNLDFPNIKKLLNREHNVFDVKFLKKPNFISTNKIKLIEQLGEGNYGVVYKGLCNDENCEVTNCVIKSPKLNNNKDQNKKIIKDFICEGSIMSQLDHPNIVKIMGISTDKFIIDNSLKIVLKIYSHGDLETNLLKRKDNDYSSALLIIQRNTNKIKTNLEIGYDIVTGMKYLSSKKILHNDLAARNILINVEESNVVCKIGDFGLSVMYNKSVNKNISRPVSWSAPERFIIPPNLTEKSDVWSFGAVLIEIITNGEVPFSVCDCIYINDNDNDNVINKCRKNKLCPKTNYPKRLWDLKQKRNNTKKNPGLKFSRLGNSTTVGEKYGKSKFVWGYIKHLNYFIKNQITEVNPKINKIIKKNNNFIKKIIKKCWNNNVNDRPYFNELYTIFKKQINKEKIITKNINMKQNLLLESGVTDISYITELNRLFFPLISTYSINNCNKLFKLIHYIVNNKDIGYDLKSIPIQNSIYSDILGTEKVSNKYYLEITNDFYILEKVFNTINLDYTNVCNCSSITLRGGNIYDNILDINEYDNDDTHTYSKSSRKPNKYNNSKSSLKPSRKPHEYNDDEDKQVINEYNDNEDNTNASKKPIKKSRTTSVRVSKKPIKKSRTTTVRVSKKPIKKSRTTTVSASKKQIKKSRTTTVSASKKLSKSNEYNEYNYSKSVNNTEKCKKLHINSEGESISKIDTKMIQQLLENEKCDIIYGFINIYKKTRLGINHKNAIIIDKINKKIIRFEPKKKTQLSKIANKLRYKMSEDIIRNKLGNNNILNDYNYILIRGNQPTNIKQSGMYCVVYSMYSILLFVLNYNSLNTKIYENKQISLTQFNSI